MARRAVFFVIGAAISLALLPLCPPELRYVGWTLAIVFVILAAGSCLDFRSRHRRHG